MVPIDLNAPLPLLPQNNKTNHIERINDVTTHENTTTNNDSENDRQTTVLELVKTNSHRKQQQLLQQQQLQQQQQQQQLQQIDLVTETEMKKEVIDVVENIQNAEKTTTNEKDIERNVTNNEETIHLTVLPQPTISETPLVNIIQHFESAFASEEQHAQ
jgi:HD-GYP domain-containing protein (c-di-GMP phosphodiesterase class II)